MGLVVYTNVFLSQILQISDYKMLQRYYKILQISDYKYLNTRMSDPHGS